MVTLTVEFLYAKEMKLPSGVCMKDGIHFLQNCGFHSLHTPLLRDCVALALGSVPLRIC